MGNGTERFLVTGALGCIGAWTVRLLADAGAAVIGADLADDTARWRLLDPSLARRVPLVRSDVTDGPGFERLVAEREVTHIVHLAALQVPFARARPLAGARVNVEGMAVVLEAARARREQVRGVSFASSIAVYGPPGRYGAGPLANDAPAAPTTLYGAHKLAGEWMSRIYERDHGVVSIGLRPAVVYGPGRDQGLTSSPTLAMLATAAGRSHRVAWGGPAGYHHARDVAAAFVAAARACEDGGGSETYTLPVHTRTMDDVVAAIGAGAGVTYDPAPLPFPSAFDAAAAERRLVGLPMTPFAEGVRESVETFRAAIAEGRLDADRLLAAG